jgi:hypothetical protein
MLEPAVEIEREQHVFFQEHDFRDGVKFDCPQACLPILSNRADDVIG